MNGDEKKYVEEAFLSNWIAPVGPHIDAFESEFASYLGVKGAVAVSSGTAAIHLALSLLEIGRGDKVFCSTLTFVASANPILYLGGEPIFIDSDYESWNMSPIALERALIDANNRNDLPKAVIVVHLYGQNAKMDEIMCLCRQYEIPVIEDSAESLGSLYKGIKSGSMGELGIFSFNGNKIITTSGGGMLVSNQKKFLEKAKFLASQAKDVASYYQHSQMGYNYRMSNILAGVGRAQLKVLEERIFLRRNVFRLYKKALETINGVSFMPEYTGSESTRWLTVLLIDKEICERSAAEMVESFNNHAIEARAVWKPLHLQPLFKGTQYYSHLPGKHVAEDLFKQGICLPSGSNLSLNDQKTVIEHFRQCVNHSFGQEAVI
ncbi:DegT/DnrJ/EryC1/StrS family aminotransferase [Salipaludibacillus sp. HK11]|uniref:DegT/DnrJ/EryC1/StrS family aminotransferase n=1 Tax=Salipaludibacillus sp. HK11 TaxID=3394320 RepID=UPI0039FBC5A2